MSRRDDPAGGSTGPALSGYRPVEASDTVRLGLIGDNIAASRSPQLHRLAGELCGLRVEYDLLIPRQLGAEFEEVFEQCAAQGLRGVNVTYPYKERVTTRVRFADARLRSIGGINTVVFGAGEPVGYNTDYSGFIAAWQRNMDGINPGTVCLVGAGGVGKAVAFALADLGLDELRIVERDTDRSRALARALAADGRNLRIEIARDAAQAARGADGLVNCTPIGMVGIAGRVLGHDAMRGASWAFDAVYTPVDTEFLINAAAEGLRVLSGYELFFYQGMDAFARFTGRRPDENALRNALTAGLHPAASRNDPAEVE